jgi:DNA-binding beta-propeller fold protein YncE
MTSDGTYLYVTDQGNEEIRRVTIASGEVVTWAGAKAPACVDGVGVAARFYHPCGITTDGASLFVADTGNHKIRVIK